MAKILLIISALVIAATAYLGFATKQKVEGIVTELSDKKKSLGIAQTDLTKTKGTLKKTEEELVGAKADIEVKEKDIAGKKGEIDSLGAKLTEASTALAAKIAEIEALTKRGDGTEPAIDLVQLKKDFDETKAAKADLEVKVAELTQIRDTMSKKVSEEVARTAAEKQKVEEYKRDFTKPGVTGTILAHNAGWNFVVINIGDRQSVKIGKVFVVTRDGQMVGKVRVTSVEPSTSIADVIPSTVPKGDSVQPGDRVIYEVARAK